MDNRLFGPVVETAVEKILRFAYGTLMDIEWYLAKKNVIGTNAKDGIYDESDLPCDPDGIIH
jgi:hypothetical protein